MSIGIPTVAVILGMITNVFLFNALSIRMSSLEARMLSLETTFNRCMGSVIGKLSELDARLTILADRSGR